jgi:hypothetical protein
MRSPHVLTLLLLATACADYRLGDGPDASGGGGGVGSGLGGGVGGGDGSVGGGGGGQGGGGEDPTFAGCIDVGRQVLLAPLDLFLLLDVSGSMDYDYKWPGVKSALKSFIGNPRFDGLGVGVQYFPLVAQCRVDAYQAPAVPIGLLPGNAARIGDSLNEQRMAGGTPTVPALEGATAYARSYLQLPANAGRKAAVVLATDGVPDQSCAGPAPGDAGLPNSLDNVVQVALTAANSSPQVRTFVIGVGSELGALGQIAVAGGTGKAVLVDVAANADVQFLAALTQIRRDALGCDFPVPFLQGINLGKGQVVFVPSDGAPHVFMPRLDGVAACQKGQGWYFDDPLTPTKVVLCEASCDVVTQGRTGVLKVEFACGVN